MKIARNAVELSLLYTHCDQSSLPFAHTGELEHLDNFFGQERAAEALRFGIDIRHEGYNIFVLGPAGIGKHQMVRGFLEQYRRELSPPVDWCYVNNFKSAERPRVLQLPPGTGSRLQKDMQACVEDILVAIPGIFQSSEYKAQISELSEEYTEREQSAFQELADNARQRGVALVQTPGGYTLAPMTDDKIISPAEFEDLPEDEQERIKATITELKEDLKKVVLQLPQLMKEGRTRIKDLNRSFTENAVDQIFRELEDRYAEQSVICEFLAETKRDIVDNADMFHNTEQAGDSDNLKQRVKAFPRYLVNVLVDNSNTEGSPLVYENNPSLVNLIGRIEHEAQFGTLTTNFTLIRPGALHRANGGYLILDAIKLLSQPFAWDALKRALQSRQVKIESADQILSLASTRSLEPEPIPLNLKVILLGDPFVYYLLQSLDSEFNTLFKVPADLSLDIARSADNDLSYARLIAAIQQRRQLRPFDKGAVARVIEHGARMLEDASKLSLNLNWLTDLLCESDHFASMAEADIVAIEHVRSAISGADRRLGQMRERSREHILRDLQLIDTTGAKPAQVNGLAVFQLGDFSFGRPTRISARARLGHGKVLDIERETKLGGNIHSKAVLILSSLLANRYARNRPLPISASLVFEQSYGGVEGDSASIAEFVALISAISGVAVRQNLAVTGSLNQHGQVQVIGGINHKIEGFFDICRSRGLSGDQGVVVPAGNVQHLMLEQRVIEAVKEHQFSIFAVSTIDEAIELLLDTAAGSADSEGQYPPHSVNGRVMAQVDEWIELARKFSGNSEAEDQSGDED